MRQQLGRGFIVRDLGRVEHMRRNLRREEHAVVKRLGRLRLWLWHEERGLLRGLEVAEVQRERGVRNRGRRVPRWNPLAKCVMRMVIYEGRGSSIGCVCVRSSRPPLVPCAAISVVRSGSNTWTRRWRSTTTATLRTNKFRSALRRHARRCNR